MTTILSLAFWALIGVAIYLEDKSSCPEWDENDRANSLIVEGKLIGRYPPRGQK